MFNKNFIPGVLTTLFVVVILATAGLVVVAAFKTPDGVWGISRGRPGGLEQQGGDRQFEFDGPSHQGAPGQGDRRFSQRGGDITAAPLHGIGGVLGSLVLIGLIVAVVAGGSRLFKRFRSRPASPPAPVRPADAEGKPLVETRAAHETPEELVAERPAVLPEELVEPGEPPEQPPAGKNK